MSISTEILSHVGDGIDSIRVDKNATLYGESAVEVVVHLDDGRTVTGTFTTEPREGFGGVVFSQKKDIVGLMVSKIRAVLDGTASGR